MICPKCMDQVLVPLDRDGVEVDYCPGCRGLWLDRGELDKALERARPRALDSAGDFDRRERGGRRHDEDDDFDRDSHERGHRKRRGGFLADLLDFD